MKKGVQLRALTLEDAKITWKWRNRPEIMDNYAGHPFPVNYEMEKIWYEKILYSNIPISVFGIETIESNKLVGMVCLRKINFINRDAEIGLFIGDVKERDRGFAKAATLQCMEIAFNRLGLNRIYAKVIEDNKAAIHIFGKCGLKKEGILRECVFKNNQFKNQVVMSILKREFEILEK